MEVFCWITIALTAGYAGMILMYWYGWVNLKNYSRSEDESLKVTIIVPVRDEASNIQNCLASLKSQTYPNIEIIIVDDHSDDETTAMIQSAGIAHLQLLHLEDYLADKKITAYKKSAIEYAISKASGDYMVTTDADCIHDKDWIKSLVGCVDNEDADMVTGPVVMTSNSMFEGMQALDFAGLVGIAGASTFYGFQNLCNGANLGYSKEMFERVEGFNDNKHIPSGDDMFLMHKIDVADGEIIYNKSKEGIVETPAEKTFGEFWHQRLRWTSKSTSYNDKRITLLLIMSYFFNLAILASGIMSFICADYLVPFAISLGVKLLVEFIFLFTVTGFLKRRGLLWLFLPAQILHIPYVLIIGIAGTFGSYQWKGRKT